MCQVRNAFGAVELGNLDLDCDGQAEALDSDNDSITNIRSTTATTSPTRIRPISTTTASATYAIPTTSGR